MKFKRIIFFLLTVFLFIFSFSGLNGQCKVLVWQDEFNYSGKPDPEKWIHETGGGGWGNQELQYYTNRIENSYVENGVLKIKAIKEYYSGNSYTSARLNSTNDGSWKYGRIEVRAKLPSGRGTWPAIWTLPDDWVYGGWPASGEIDIMEHVGYDQGVIHGTVHTDAYNHTRGTQKGGQIYSSTVSDSFHVYAIEWTEEKIDFFFDDSLYFTFHNEHKTYAEWPFDQDFHLLLNIAIGGNWGGAQGVDPSLTEAIMEIDYVRVYKKPENTIIEGNKNVIPLENEVLYTLNHVYPYFDYQWEVSGGELSGTLASDSVLVNWGCEPVSVICHIISDCDTTSVDFPVMPREPAIKAPMFIGSEEDSVRLETDYQGADSYSWEIIAGDGEFSTNPDSSVVMLKPGITIQWINVNITDACASYSLEKKIFPAGQYPYPDPQLPNEIPGVIESVNYDYGGQNVAYYDADITNQGPGPRSEESVDTEFGDAGNPNVGWTTTGEWMEYTITVPKDTFVRVNARVASNVTTSKGPLNIIINGEERASLDIPYTGAWDAFKIAK